MIRAFQWDLARQLERLDWLIAQFPRYADWGYQEVYLHLEDAIEYPSLPEVARPGAFSQRQLGKLVNAAARSGIRVVPIVNLLGHTQYLVKVPGLRDLNELRAPDGSPLPRGQICPAHPRTLEVADRLLRDVAPFCTAGKVHLGLDESFHLGRHPLSRADIETHGLPGHFARYVQRLHGLVSDRALRAGMWADMLYFLPEAIPRLPSGMIAYDWYYYPFRRHPRVEIFNYAERDLAGPLRAQGIEYWGCPMNSGFRYEPLPLFGDRLANIRSWWDRCRRVGAGGMLVTSWESSRLAQELCTVIDAAAASLWLDRGPRTDLSLLTAGFRRASSRSSPRLSAAAALAADAFPQAGYARWETYDRWDVAAGDAAPFRRELAALRRLSRRSRIAPALAASLRFRAYLAAREVFIREAADGVRNLRRVGSRSAGGAELLSRLERRARAFEREIAAAGSAVRAMWTPTRRARGGRPNLDLIRDDRGRLRQWKNWLGSLRRDPTLVTTPSPVIGGWQIDFKVLNFAPCLQKVALEQGDGSGGWNEIRSRFTIEFQAVGANSRARIVRGFSAPLMDPTLPLRISVRGTGPVKIGYITLTDGIGSLSAPGKGGRGWTRIGNRAPSKGLPEFDWTRNTGSMPVRFPK